MGDKVYISGAGLIEGTQNVEGNYIICKEQYEEYIEGLKIRNFDRISKLTLAAAKLALTDRKLEIITKQKNYGLILGTQFGSVDSIHSFDRTCIDKGALNVNPGLFPNTVLNAPACQAGIQFGIAGPIYTVVNGLNSSLEAVGLAFKHVQHGVTPLILAGGVDEISELQQKISGEMKNIFEACGFVILEGGELLKEAAECKGEILGYYSIGFTDSDTLKISQHINEVVSEMVESFDDVGYISLCTTLIKEQEDELLNILREYFGNDLIYEGLNKNCMAATGIQKIISSLDLSLPSYKSVILIINIDMGNLSILTLKKLNTISR